MLNDRTLSGSRGFIQNAILLTAFILPMYAMGQISNDVDQGILTPPQTVTLGRQDPTALQVIREYRQVVQTDSWSGVQGQGDLVPNAPDASGAASAAQLATLWILGGDKFRLDIQKPKGLTSLRMNGAYEATQHEDGRIHQIDARNALSGLFAFPSLMEANFPDVATSLIDQGIVEVDSVPLHRITMGTPWPGVLSSNQAESRTTITDLYFDPHTNLLIKSASLAVGSKAEPSRYLRVIDYGDYRSISGFDLPYQYSERFNGQLLWTLQMNTIQLQSDLTDSGFHF